MSTGHEMEKQLQRYKYRAQLAEAENTAVKSSRAYRIVRLIGSMKADFKKNPVGLTRKAAHLLLTQPLKIVSRGKNREIVTQSVIEQTNKYQEWILLNEPQGYELQAQYRESEQFSYQPLISIVTPVFNPPVKVLEELIESVLEQTYPHFELCLGDFGDDPCIKELLEKYAKLDDRVKNWPFTENKGISSNSNAIFEKISGEYIGLLDHDDTLSPDALFENVKALNQERYDFIYSDKDKIDELNNRFDPLFKAQFSPEMLLNINYLTHFNVMSAAIVKRVGQWDPTTDGAQDWDLFLKVVTEAKKIHHIPKVLYHWRVIASSTALSIETKPYALAGQRKAIDKYLDKKSIPGKATHHKTELVIDWSFDAIPNNPIVIVNSSSIVRTRYIMRKVLGGTPQAQFVIVGNLSHETTLHPKVIGYADKSVYGVGAAIDVLKDHDIDMHNQIVVGIDDSLILERDWYSKLVGWLSVPGVGAVSGRIVDRHDTIIDSGGIVSKNQYQPLFLGFPKYYQGYIGNAEWVRNLNMLSGVFFATHGGQLNDYTQAYPESNHSISHYFAWLVGRNKRLVVTPQSTVITHNSKHIEERLSSITLDAKMTGFDAYSSQNVSPDDPMRLFNDETFAHSGGVDVSEIDHYQHDAIILAQSYDITQEEIDLNLRTAKEHIGGQPKTAALILPSFDAIYAGLMNIFTFAQYLQNNKNLEITFYVLSAKRNLHDERAMIVAKLPSLRRARYIAINEQQIDRVSRHDIGIATLWSTAYVLAKSRNIRKKYYFIQDNETNFYPKGSISALVEMSYRFGFYAIANTQGLLDMYSNGYEGSGTVLPSKVDLSSYFPNPNPYLSPRKPYKVFFYARPNMPRNAFELGIAGLRKLKIQMGEAVEIITAGAAWDPAVYGVAGMFTNLGKLNYEAVPKLYRSVDVGLMFMFSGHPGVTASELMASGCPVVVNEYDDITWNDLYQHEKTCLITKATASEVAHSLSRCLTDDSLREQLIRNGLEKASTFYGGYADQLELAYKDILRHYNQ